MSLPTNQRRGVRHRHSLPGVVRILPMAALTDPAVAAVFTFDALLIEVSLNGFRLGSKASIGEYESRLRLSELYLEVTTQLNGKPWVQRGGLRWVTTQADVTEIGVQCLVEDPQRAALVERLLAPESNSKLSWLVAGLVVAAIAIGAGLVWTQGPRTNGGNRATSSAIRDPSIKQATHERAAEQPLSASAPASRPSAVDERYAQWRKMEAKHEARPSLDGQAKQQAEAKANAYFEAVTLAMQKSPLFAKQKATVKRIDCKQGGCVVEAQFPDFAGALAYVGNLKDNRFAYDLKVMSSTGCPFHQAALPRIPGQKQEGFTALLNFACDEAGADKSTKQAK